MIIRLSILSLLTILFSYIAKSQSCGFNVSLEEVVKTVHHFLRDDINICPHCYDGTLLKGEKNK